MTNDRIDVMSSVPVRKFVRVYQDFLYSEILTAEEKMVFIALKSFVDFSQDEDEVFPSMDTICKITGMSRPRATRTINSLVSKGIIKKQGLRIFGKSPDKKCPDFLWLILSAYTGLFHFHLLPSQYFHRCSCSFHTFFHPY